MRIHDLRHSFASRALKLLGEGLPMIGKLLGHTQVQTRPLRSPRPRYRQGFRRPHRRQHRTQSGGRKMILGRRSGLAKPVEPGTAFIG